MNDSPSRRRAAAILAGRSSHIRGDLLRGRLAFTLLELLVVIGVIGVLVALLIPAVQQVRESSRRATCVSNLRGLGIALDSYHSALGRYPPGHVVGSGTPAGGFGWAAMIAENLEVSAPPNLSVGLASEVNRAAVTVSPGIYLCPSAPLVPPAADGELGGASYVGCAGAGESDGVLYRNSSIRKEDIRDGLAQTLLVSERLWSAPWPTYWAGDLAPDGKGVLFRSNTGPVGGAEASSGALSAWHSAGVNALFAEGTVQTISFGIDDEVFRALGTRSKGDRAEGY